MEAAAEGLTLYWDPVSQPARAVKTLLLAGNVPHKDVVVSLLKRENKGEEYLKVNPKGQVPYIRDGEFGLAESNAILKYIAETQPSVPEHYWPKDPQQRALVDQYLEFYQFHFRPALIAPIRVVMAKALYKVETPQDAQDFGLAQVTQTLDIFEKMVNKHEGDFIVNNEITIADLQLYYEILDVNFYNPALFDNYPGIKEWIAKVGAVKEVQQVQELNAAALIPFQAALAQAN